MNTLLAALTTFTLSAPPALAPIATKSLANEGGVSTQVEWDIPESMYNLQFSADQEYERSTGKTITYVETVGQTVQRKYDEFFKNKTAVLSVLSSTPVSEKVEQRFENVYENNTPSQQTFKTQEYSREISTTATFSSSISESLDVSVSTAFSFAGVSINASLSSSQTWTETRTVTEKVTAPSQDFTVDPFSKGIATYTIKSGEYRVKGVLRSYVSLADSSRFNSTIYTEMDSGARLTYGYKYPELIRHLVDSGWSDIINVKSPEFSIISVDNPDNPNSVSFNIPISYVAKGGKLEVDFRQEPLK